MDAVVFRETTVHFYSYMRHKLMRTGRTNDCSEIGN